MIGQFTATQAGSHIAKVKHDSGFLYSDVFTCSTFLNNVLQGTKKFNRAVSWSSGGTYGPWKTNAPNTVVTVTLDQMSATGQQVKALQSDKSTQQGSTLTTSGNFQWNQADGTA